LDEGASEARDSFPERRSKHMSRFVRLLKTVHEDERGAVSLETILIIGAIALPILIFLIKVGWPRVKTMWESGMKDLEDEKSTATSPGS
jgi:hypothetical protein